MVKCPAHDGMMMVRFRPGRIYSDIAIWRSSIGRILDFKSEDTGSSPVAIGNNIPLVSLMVERPAFNRCDAGSIPARGNIIFIIQYIE